MTTNDPNPPSGDPVVPDPDDADADARAEMALQFGWLQADALDLFLDSWFETGNLVTSWEMVRDDPRYDTWFPGNLTDDGRPRISEESYATKVREYDDVFASVGLDPANWRNRYGDLISGDVKPDELEGRLIPMHDRIVKQSDALRATYARYYGVVMTDAALLASAIDPGLGDKILLGQISVAEIGGEAAESGFNIDKEFALRMWQEAGTTRGEAESIFQRAESIQPALAILSARHADPDDAFDLEDFVSADLFADPEERRRIARLLAQEKATYSGGAQIDYTRTQSGGVAGLLDR